MTEQRYELNHAVETQHKMSDVDQHAGSQNTGMQSFCTVVHAPSKLEEAMNMLLGVFEKYAVKHGDRLQLSNREMGNLFRGELHDLMKEASNRPQKFREILSSLDKNLDGQVNFEEFVSMATKLIMCTSPYFDKYGGGLMCGYE